MVFKQFRWVVVFCVVILFITMLLLAWLLIQTNYFATIAIVAILLVVEVFWLIRYVEKTNIEITRFLSSIHYDDFSTSYSTARQSKTFLELHRALNQVMRKFQEIRAEKEAQYHYLRSIVQHVSIGLLAVDDNQQIQLINNASKRLLQVSRIDYLSDLEVLFPTLVKSIKEMKSGEKRVLKLRIKGETTQLAINATNITLLGKTYQLISLQDIHLELEEKEMEAWQNLTRVLTHEIINSVTPITSLASTLAEELNEQVNQHGGYEFIEPTEIEDAHKAIQVIEKRSTSLVNFVTEFRNFSKVPSPKFQLVTLESLIKEIEILMRDDFKKNNISFHCQVTPKDLKISADPTLIEQILINLIKNSVQALYQTTEAKIEVQAYTDESGKVLVKVKDNGAGISEEALKSIFVPFYTTKKTGSGIGLSLSRQIMRMHGGTILVKSEPKVETVFTLKFA